MSKLILNPEFPCEVLWLTLVLVCKWNNNTNELTFQCSSESFMDEKIQQRLMSVYTNFCIPSVERQLERFGNFFPGCLF